MDDEDFQAVKVLYMHACIFHPAQYNVVAIKRMIIKLISGASVFCQDDFFALVKQKKFVIRVHSDDGLMLEMSGL